MEIKPCPFCGSEDIEVFSIDDMYHTHCIKCEAEGNWFDSYDDAVMFWNQRPYDYDMPAIVKKVQRLEEENKQLHDLLIRADINLQQWIISFPQAADKEDSAILDLFKEVKESCKQPE